jgi:hypothetical protein
MKENETRDNDIDNLNIDNLEELNEFIDDDIIMDNFDDENDDSVILSDDIESEDEECEECEECEEDEIMFKFNTNNHKLEGKHSLLRDTIFKGKIESQEDSQSQTYQDEFNANDGLPIEIGTNYEFESRYHEEYINRLNLQKDVYNLLDEKTDLDFSSNRRKPNRNAFNDYYRMLLDNIGKDYTKSEIFVELSYYFTDNIFNMFKLLDKECATQIIIELKQSGYLTNLNNINFI